MTQHAELIRRLETNAALMPSDAAVALEYKAAAEALKEQAAEIERLRKVLAPFAAYEQVRSTMGGCTPKEGLLWAVEARAGRAELTVEDMQAAVAAMAMKGQP